MGASVGPNKGGAKSDINVTPLIDIVLVLLIVFIVMVPGMTKAAKVTVPQVVTTSTPPPPSANDTLLVLQLDEKGNLAFNSIDLQPAQLPDKLVPELKKQPINGRKVTFKVDEEVTYQRAVDVLDQIRLADDRAKKETAEDPRFQGVDGGDVKVLISMKKR